MIKRIIFYSYFLMFTFIVTGCSTTSRTVHSKTTHDYKRQQIQKIPQTVKVTVLKSDNIQIDFDTKIPLIIQTSLENKRLLVKRVYISNGSVYSDGKYKQGISSIYSEDSVSFLLNNKRYKGKVHILISNGVAQLLLEISVRDYIMGVVSGEMPKMFQKEYAKVQTVVAYTYFIYKYLYNKRIGLEYMPFISELEQKYVYKESSDINEQVDKVFGVILIYKDKLFPPFYHSTCGGITDSAYETFEDKRWQDVKPLNGGVECAFCGVSPYYQWNLYKSKDEINKLFRVTCKGNTKILPLKRASYGNIMKMAIYCGDSLQKIVNAFAFRNKVGMSQLKSYNFDVRERENSFIFSGKGFGHRVGLCQYGANEMIKAGYSYIDVLKYYYPEAKIVNIEEAWAYLKF